MWIVLFKLIGEVRAKSLGATSPQELAAFIYPKANDLVPPSVRKELQEDIRQFLDAHIRIA
jgi:hypothetical protein